MIKINLNDTYEPVQIATDQSYMTFYTECRTLTRLLLTIEISPLGDPFLPNVFNLSFGPLLENGKIDDKAKINHACRDKMFSTILLFCVAFLQSNPGISIGIDGSDDARAYLYHRMVLTNRAYLSDYFVIIGVDWYVRLLRDGNVELDADELPFFKPKPEPFDYSRLTRDLYRYYIFHQKR